MVLRRRRDFRQVSIQIPCTEAETTGMSEPQRIRRLRLVPRAGERDELPLSGTAAVRRYRLARMERVAELSPADADSPGPRAIPDGERRPAEGLG